MLDSETQQIDEAFLKDVLNGLSKDQKKLEPKYFYDAHGSALFDQICTLEEYYPTRTELGVLSDQAEEIADLIEGQHLIEFGSGSSVKIRILLDAAEKLASYVPVDISRDHLLGAANAIANDYPDLHVLPVCADFTQTFELPQVVANGERAGFFPGSTIGNFSRDDAKQFLSMAASMLGTGGGLVIGVDLKKDPDVLHAAYNDQQGVTAAFNLNLLTRINRELNGTFDLEAFAHDARYVEREGRVEMHLVSLKDQTVSVHDHSFEFAKDESIHTENSHKYDIDEFHQIGRETGFAPDRTWTDANNLFSVHYLKVAA
ncbi:MAG: L-histidine N(alpha)-methyltransferase [Rhodospirillaceae bacterium]